MITYFSEKDLVSFGNFLLSPARKKAYITQGLPPDKLTDMLLTVNSFDLTTWFNTIVKAAKAPDTITEPDAQDANTVIE